LTWPRPTRRRRLLLAAALLGALWAPPAHSAGARTSATYEIPARPPTIAEKAFDLVLLRPLGLVQTAVGAALFAVFYPVSLVTGGSDHVVDYCWKSPVHQTFQRPLGAL
jgi:hypothetical protein